MNTPTSSGRRQRQTSSSTGQAQPPPENIAPAQATRQSTAGTRARSQPALRRSTAQHNLTRAAETPAVRDTIKTTRQSCAGARDSPQPALRRSAAQHNLMRAAETPAVRDTIKTTRQSSEGARDSSQPASPSRLSFQSLTEALESSTFIRVTISEGSENLQTRFTGEARRGPQRLAESAGRLNSPGSADRKIQIGIEAEFMIAAKDTEHSRPTVECFVAALARQHDKSVNNQHPRMRPFLRPYEERGDYERWCLVLDSSIGYSDRSPWAIELVSPILKAFPGSRWRKDVEATWRYLGDFYTITKNVKCSTHIHISLDPFYSVPEIKRIAQAVIHFEPALEVLVPDFRRRTHFAKSNWLHANFLAADNKSRSQSVAYIEEQRNLRQVVDAVQRPRDRDFCWNFQNLLLPEKRTIEFRKPPASTTAEEALSWAEFAMSFVQSSIKCESAAKLQDIPPNLGGLDWFLRQSNVAGVNERYRLRRIWAGKGLDAFLEPSYTQELDPTSQLACVLEQRLAKDKTEIRRLARAREPYW